MGKDPPSLRPPPPARHRRMDGSPMDPVSNIVPTPTTVNRKRNSEGRSRPYYFRRCKGKKSLTNIESLPDELVFEILLHLPAEDIYDNAMLVCRRWYRIIRTHDFIHAHRVHRSTPGLLVHDSSPLVRYRKQYATPRRHHSTPRLLVHDSSPLVKSPSYFVEMRQGRIEVSKFNYKIKDIILASCNGLIMEYDISQRLVQINNPAIRRRFAYPPFIREHIFINPCCSIAYSAASMKYKVFRTTYGYGDGGCRLRCAIATLGVDKSWRDVCIQHLSIGAKDHLYTSNTVVTEGFIHWTHSRYKTLVLTLNVETETFTQYPVPQGQDYENSKKYYLSTGKSLSVFVSSCCFSMEVWEMKSESGEWTKMWNIDLEPRVLEFVQFRSKKRSIGFIGSFFLEPVGWLKCREVVVLRVSNPPRVCFAYNVLTREIDSFELDDDTSRYKFHLHTNNLVGLI